MTRQRPAARQCGTPTPAQAKISPALASPSNFVEMTFNATRRLALSLVDSDARAEQLVVERFQWPCNSATRWTPAVRRSCGWGRPSSAEVVLQDGSSGAADHGWGWSDNGWGVPGVNIYFASTGTHTIRYTAARGWRCRRSDRPESRNLSDDRARPAPRRHDDYFTVKTDISGSVIGRHDAVRIHACRDTWELFKARFDALWE